MWKLIPNRWIVLHFSKLDLLRPDVLRPVQNSKLMEPKIHLATRKVWKRRTGQPNSQVRRLHKRRTSGQNGQLQLLYLLLLISWHALLNLLVLIQTGTMCYVQVFVDGGRDWYVFVIAVIFQTSQSRHG